jgi:hypothetical protein
MSRFSGFFAVACFLSFFVIAQPSLAACGFQASGDYNCGPGSRTTEPPAAVDDAPTPQRVAPAANPTPPTEVRQSLDAEIQRLYDEEQANQPPPQDPGYEDTSQVDVPGEENLSKVYDALATLTPAERAEAMPIAEAWADGDRGLTGSVIEFRGGVKFFLGHPLTPDPIVKEVWDGLQTLSPADRALAEPIFDAWVNDPNRQFLVQRPVVRTSSNGLTYFLGQPLGTEPQFNEVYMEFDNLSPAEQAAAQPVLDAWKAAPTPPTPPIVDRQVGGIVLFLGTQILP